MRILARSGLARSHRTCNAPPRVRVRAARQRAIRSPCAALRQPLTHLRRWTAAWKPREALFSVVGSEMMVAPSSLR